MSFELLRKHFNFIEKLNIFCLRFEILADAFYRCSFSHTHKIFATQISPSVDKIKKIAFFLSLSAIFRNIFIVNLAISGNEKSISYGDFVCFPIWIKIIRFLKADFGYIRNNLDEITMS